MKRKIDYRSGEECLHATYKDMEDMTLDDAVFILSESVRKYHEAKQDSERVNLPRPRMIKAYEMVIEAATKSNMREKIKEYISELDEENSRCNLWVKVHINGKSYDVAIMESRIETLVEVKNDLQGKLEELI